MDARVIIVGLGALGAAAAWALGRRGIPVLGLDRNAPPHALGSSHGLSRIIRRVYFEGQGYVPFVRLAYQGWSRLERDSGRRLLEMTGGLTIGPEGGELIRGALAGARAHGLPHRVLSAKAIRERYPVLRPAPGMVGVLDEGAGILHAEACVTAALDASRDLGAEIRLQEGAIGWKARADRVRVETGRGSREGGCLILAPGPWMPQLLDGPAAAVLRVDRQVVHWVAPEGEPVRFRGESLPVTVWEYEPERYFYAVPDLGDGVKVGIHYQGEATSPDTVDRTVSAGETEGVRRVVEPFLPGAFGRVLDRSVCLYTNTPDRAFLLGPHPRHPAVLLAGGGSGHGFKFAPAVGEVLADLVQGRKPPVDLGPFDPGRFGR